MVARQAGQSLGLVRTANRVAHRAGVKQLKVMSRPGCHLCEQVIEELVPLVRGRADLEVIDIDTDPELVARYGLRVPVVVADDRDLSEFPLDVQAVNGFLSVFD